MVIKYIYNAQENSGISTVERDVENNKFFVKLFLEVLKTDCEGVIKKVLRLR
jgi:hypothetical protein